MNSDKKELIRTIYLYVACLIGLFLITIGTGRLVTLGLKTWIFEKAEEPLVYPEYPEIRAPITYPSPP